MAQMDLHKTWRYLMFVCVLPAWWGDDDEQLVFGVFPAFSGPKKSPQLRGSNPQPYWVRCGGNGRSHVYFIVFVYPFIHSFCSQVWALVSLYVRSADKVFVISCSKCLWFCKFDLSPRKICGGFPLTPDFTGDLRQNVAACFFSGKMAVTLIWDNWQ